jgi:hypothetical protein
MADEISTLLEIQGLYEGREVLAVVWFHRKDHVWKSVLRLLRLLRTHKQVRIDGSNAF